jgi:hypothetical protein
VSLTRTAAGKREAKREAPYAQDARHPTHGSRDYCLAKSGMERESVADLTTRAAGTRWLAHMRRGDLQSAWSVSDEVLAAHAGVPCDSLPRHLQYVWDGTPLDGKRVLIRCYHGLGDTIHFVRYAPLVHAVASEVIVWAQPELIPLLRSCAGIDRVEPLHDGTPQVPYDVDVEIMELPHVFRSTLATLPCDVPYLTAPPATRRRDGRLSVGLVARAGGWDERRSIPLDLLAPLSEGPGVHIQLLHEASPTDRDLFEIAHGTDTVLGTAGLMRALDLVVSVDSMPAHLAGALGVPVWTLLRHDADWRWMRGRDDSPWYPTMRLFRQSLDGDWTPVIERVHRELARLGSD